MMSRPSMSWKIDHDLRVWTTTETSKCLHSIASTTCQAYWTWGVNETDFENETRSWIDDEWTTFCQLESWTSVFDGEEQVWQPTIRNRFILWLTDYDWIEWRMKPLVSEWHVHMKINGTWNVEWIVPINEYLRKIVVELYVIYGEPVHVKDGRVFR